MSRQARSILALCLLLESTAFADPPAAKVDRYGDPLPPGAIARLGSIRFRQRADHFDSSIAFAPDGKALAMTFSDDSGSGVRILDVPTGRMLRHFDAPEKAELYEVAFSPDGKLLAARANHQVFLWGMATGKRLTRALGHHDDIRCFAFLPDGKTLATGYGQRPGQPGCPIRFWDLKSGRELHRLEGHVKPVEQLVVSRDGKALLSCSFDASPREDDQKGSAPGTVCVWDLASAKLVRQQKTGGCWALLAPDRKICIYCPDTKTHQIRECDADRELFKIEGESVGCAFSPDGRTLAVTQQVKDMRLLDAATGKELRRFAGSACWGHSFARFSPDGKKLATCNKEYNGHSAVRLWDIATGKELRQTSGHRDVVTCVVLTPDGKTAVSGSRDGTVRIWDMRTSKEMRVYAGHEGAITALAASPDGRIMASADRTGAVHLVEFGSGKVLHCLNREEDPHYQQVGSLAFTPDGKTLLVGSRTNAVCLFDALGGKRLRRIAGYHSLFHDVAFSAESDVVASTGFVGEGSGKRVAISIRSLRTGQELGRIEGEEKEEDFYSLVFSPDGKILAAGRCLSFRFGSAGDQLRAWGDQLRAWEVATLKEVLRIETPYSIGELTFSPDSRTLVGSSGVWRGSDPALHLWDLGTGLELGRIDGHLDGHLSGVTSLAFSGDSKTLVSGSADGTALVWGTASFPKGEGRPGQGPSPKDVPAYWAKLNGDDVAAAHSAGWTLALLPGPTVEFLRERVSPARPVDDGRIARLIDTLESKRFIEREKATAELEELAELAVPALRKVQARPLSVEVRQRVGRLLGVLENPVLSGPRLRAVRVTAVLERIGTPEARRLLEDFAKGAPEARLTQEAKAALRRLAEKDPPREKMLFDFEDATDLKAWSNLELSGPTTKEPPARFELSKENATSGKHSLKITFDGGEWPTLTTTEVPADWNAYHTFKADVTVDRPCVVGFTALQEKSRRGGDWDGAVSRWTKTAILRPGKNEITGVLQPNEYSAINPKLGKVVRFEVFLYRPRKGESIFVDNIRLLTRKEPPPPPSSARFKVLGTDLTVANVQELAKKLEKRWTPPKPRTAAEVEDEFRSLYAELKKKHPRAVLAVLRDGEKGYDPRQPDKVYAGWKDAYWSSHGPDGMTAKRALNYGKHANHEVFMRHRSPLMRIDLSSVPRGSEVLAARLVVVRAGDSYDKERHPEKMPNLWVAEPCNCSWEEYEVNAYQYARDKLWKAIGGMYYGDDPDFLPLYIAHGPGGGKVNVWDFREAVKFWTDGKHANHGFMLHCDSRDYMRAHTREAKEVKDRPALLVIYDPK